MRKSHLRPKTCQKIIENDTCPSEPFVVEVGILSPCKGLPSFPIEFGSVGAMNGPVFHLPRKLAHGCLWFCSETWVIPEKGSDHGS